jgi:hypothetical protein
MTETRSGGAHTSRTMLLSDLSSVLANCDPASNLDGYRDAVVNLNVAGKDSVSSRQRTFRYLRELYTLDLDQPEFRAFLRLWRRERDGRPLIALLYSYSRDAALSATAPAILQSSYGQVVQSCELASAVAVRYPDAYSTSIRDKIGRNALSTWTQAGYVTRSGRGPTIRARIDPTPAAVSMALVLGRLENLSGERLFTSDVARLLESPIPTLHDRTHDASRKGWLEYRSRGKVTEIDLSALIAEPADSRLPIEGGDPR